MKFKRKKILKIVVGIMGMIVWYLIFSFALFLGLQVKPLYGTLGVITSLLMLGLGIYALKRW